MPLDIHKRVATCYTPYLNERLDHYAWKAYSENRLPIFKIAKCFEQNAQDICVFRKKVVTLPPFCREDICAHEYDPLNLP